MMSEYIVAVCYLIFSFVGVSIALTLKKFFSGKNLNAVTFFIFLLVTSLFGIIHLSIMENGTSILLTFTNKWIEGNTMVRITATVFLLIQIFIFPSSNKSKRRK